MVVVLLAWYLVTAGTISPPVAWTLTGATILDSTVTKVEIIHTEEK